MLSVIIKAALEMIDSLRHNVIIFYSKFEKEDNGNTYHTIESQYGKFTRTFYLPDNVKDDAMKASYKDGILKVVIPKDEKKVVKNVIEIN